MTCPAYRSTPVTCPAYRSTPVTCPAYRSASLTWPAYRSAPVTCPAYRSTPVTWPAYRSAPVTCPANRSPPLSCPAYHSAPRVFLFVVVVVVVFWGGYRDDDWRHVGVPQLCFLGYRDDDWRQVGVPQLCFLSVTGTATCRRVGGGGEASPPIVARCAEQGLSNSTFLLPCTTSIDLLVSSTQTIIYCLSVRRLCHEASGKKSDWFCNQPVLMRN